MVKIIFAQKLLLTNTQVSKILKAFANNSSANTKISKSQLHKIVQSGGFLCRLLAITKNTKTIPKPLAKSV